MDFFKKGELSHLSRGFTALNVDHKKGVLKTARGLLRIQRAHQAVIGGDALRFDILPGGNCGCKNSINQQ